MSRLIPLLMAAALAAPLSAAAQGYRADPPAAGYRAGLPDVAVAPAPQNPDSGNVRTAEGFRRWYAGAKRPTMMIFWNRELTDEATTQYANVTASGAQVRTSEWGLGTRRQGGVVTGTSATVSGRVATTGGQYAAMAPLESSELESAFQGAWMQNGVRLIDRAVLVRQASAKATKDDRDDAQFMETLALKQGVAYLVEVLPAPQFSSPTGYTFTVRVKHLPSARLVAQFNTQAEPPAGPERLVAAPGGFQRQRDNRTTPQTVGAELAFQTMARIR